MVLADILCIFHTTGQTCAFSNSLQKRTKSCSGYSLMILIKGCKWPWSAWHSDTVNHSGGIVAHSGTVAYCTDFPHLAAGLGANAHLYSTIVYSYHRCLHVWVLNALFSIYSLMLPAHILYTLQFRLFLFSGVNVKATFKYCLGSTYLYPEWVPPLIWTLFTSEDDAGQRTWKLQQKNDATEQNAWNTCHDHHTNRATCLFTKSCKPF